MDTEFKINGIVSKAQDDRTFAALLAADPTKAIRLTIGRELIDEQIAIVTQDVHARMSDDYAGSVLGSIQKMF